MTLYLNKFLNILPYSVSLHMFGEYISKRKWSKCWKFMSTWTMSLHILIRFVLFDCLMFWSLSNTADKVTWQVSSEVSLACYSLCDTGHLFFRASPRTRDINTFCQGNEIVYVTFLKELGLSRPGLQHRSTACEANVLSIYAISTLYLLSYRGD